jgi:RNA polymerase-binding transcription factor DksA
LITASRSEELDAIFARLEEQYEAHTERLGRLLASRGDRRLAVYNLAEIASCRRAIAETARILRCMAERDFGRCLHCADDIPIDRLRQWPELRHCPGCAGVLSLPA